MHDSLQFPEQFDSAEPDLRNDPDYLVWAAGLKAELDYSSMISRQDGVARLVANGASAAEIDAYNNRYREEGLRRLTDMVMEMGL